MKRYFKIVDNGRPFQMNRKPPIILLPVEELSKLFKTELIEISRNQYTELLKECGESEPER